MPSSLNYLTIISDNLSDDGPNNYTISNSSGFSDAGTYISGPQGATKTLAIDIDSDWGTDMEEWSIELEFNYGRTGGTYASMTVFSDGVRGLIVSGNTLDARLNGSTYCTDNYYGGSTYSQSLPKNTWHRLLFERKNGGLYFYLNGQLRGARTHIQPSQNTLPTSGTLTLMSCGSGEHLHFRNLRVSRGAKKTRERRYSRYLTNYDVNFDLPIINGSVKLDNNVEVAQRNTLDQRSITKLNHYVEDRSTEIDIVGYTKTGTTKTGSNLELFEAIQADIEFSSNDIDKPVELVIGKTGEEQITFSLPRALIELPEIKIDDVLTSNIKISSQKASVDNDDISIKYET